MIVKFLPTHNGGGLGSVNYLLNERAQQGTAKILKGNEAQTRAIINQIRYKQKTCFGVLSFSEQADTISNEIKQEIIQDFERALLGDYMKDRVNILWVEHNDKNGRLELNFLIPKIDLISGKSFNPYYAKNDQFNIDLWKRTINDEYGFTSPNDPKRFNNIRIDKKDLAHYNTVAELDQTLKNLVAQGAIKSRSHMIELLESSGYQVTKKNKSGMSIVLPNQKRPNRMKGSIYDERFTDINKLSELGESESRRIQQYANRDTQAECQINRGRINENIRRRDERNKIRYKETIISDKIRDAEHKRSNIKRDEAGNHTKIAKWHNTDNSNIWASSRIFNQFLDIRETINKLSTRKQPTPAEQSRVAEVADPAEYERELDKQDNWQRTKSTDSISKPNENLERGNIIHAIKQHGAIDDTTRDSIIRRSREIADRNSQIARRNREQTEREQQAKRGLRELAERENHSLLQRLRAEFQERVRQYYNITQERIRQKREQLRKLRERTESNREYQEGIRSALNGWKERLFAGGLQQVTERLQNFTRGLQLIRERIISNKDNIKNELGEYADRVSESILQSKSAAIRRNGAEFRNCLEREIKRASTDGGLEIERELKKPERQMLVKRKREQGHAMTMKMR